MTDDEYLEIMRPMWSADFTVLDIARKLGKRRTDIYRLAARLGLGLKPKSHKAPSPPVADLDRDKLRALWAVIPLKKLPQHVGRSANVITRVAKEMGLPPKPRAEAYFDEEPEGAALADLLYRIGETTELIADIARDHNMGRRTAVELAKKHGVVRGINIRNARHRLRYVQKKAAAPPKGPKVVDALMSLTRTCPTDPDAKILMRYFAPVCRAQVVNPNAPPDAWIVGKQQMRERDMRALAARKSL